MSLRWRILLGLFGLALLLVLSALYHLRLVQQLAAANRSLSDEKLAAISLAVATERELLEHRDLRRRSAVRNDPDYARLIEQQSASLEQALSRLTELVRGTEAENPAEAALQTWHELVANASAAGAPAPGAPKPRAVDPGTQNPGSQNPAAQPTPDMAAQFGDLTQALDHLIAGLDASIRQQAGRARERAQRATTAAAVSSALALLVALVISAWIIRSVNSPLRDFAEGSAAIASGRFEHRIPTPNSREMALLAEDFNFMAARLAQLDEMKKDFITGVSHDLKSPLASMRDTLELVLDGSLGELNERQRRMLQLHLHSIESLTSMITTLLDLARLESGTVVFQPTDLAPRELLEEALHQHRGALEQNHIAVRWCLDPEVAAEQTTLRGDRALLLRALGNVLDNAVAHSPPHAEITLAASRAGNSVVLSIEDQGPGVATEERERIFDRFHRSPAARRGPRGTGLGLTLTRSIVEAHGGKVWVDDAQRRQGASHEQQSGSRFVLQLPRSS